MDQQFDKEAAKGFLYRKEQSKKKKDESLRIALLDKVLSFLKKEVKGQDIEVFLVGSIIQPYKFSKRSDIDIVLKNFQGDRFDLWTRLEKELKVNVEVILYENCSFKEYVQKEGLKVV